MSFLASHRAMISEKGMPVSIRRYSGTGPTRTYADTATTAYVRNYNSSELIGAIMQGDQIAICLVDTLGSVLPVTTNDKLVVDGKELAIKNVKKRREGSTLIALEVHATG